VTETEWLNAVRIDADVIDFALLHLSERKRRLFACACCRRIWHFLAQRELQNGVEAAEQFADGSRTKRSLGQVRRKIGPQANTVRNFHAFAVLWALDRHEHYPLCSAQYASEALAFATTGLFWSGDYGKIVDGEKVEQIKLLRDVLGNPFQPVTTNPTWLTTTVVALAQGIYAERAFDRLPILADALQDAGCDNTDIITHCCDESLLHTRGCWVVDLVLRK
jgi:hypothetical protein